MSASLIAVPPTTRFPGGIAAALVVWLVLAVAAGATGFLVRLPFPGPQLIILGLIGATVAAGVGSARLRDWIDAIPLRVLVGVNALRFVGIAFLVLAARGQLDAAFAGRAGWGDIAVAIGAIVLVLTSGPLTAGRRISYHAWNAFGFLDLVVAVGTATAATLQGATPGVEPVLTLPLSLIPTLLVPLFIANHVFIFRRLLGHAR
jgi:hypothetical protein